MTTAAREHSWLPKASCDASCVPAGGADAGRRLVVWVRTTVRVVMAVLLAPGVPLLAVPIPGRSHVQRFYCRLMLRCFGVRIALSGGPIRNLQGVLVVSGHVSWLDIFTVGAVLPGSFVARADLVEWPAVGRLARVMKVIPIDRGSLRRLPAVVHTVAERLRAGHGGGLPGGHHVVRAGLRGVPAGDVPGCDRRGQAGSAVAAGLPPPRRTAVDDSGVRRRRHPAAVGAAGHHRTSHGMPRPCGISAAARRRSTGTGPAL